MEGSTIIIITIIIIKEGREDWIPGWKHSSLLFVCLSACLHDRLARIEISISIIITTYQFMTAIHTCRLHFSFFSLVEENKEIRGDHSG